MVMLIIIHHSLYYVFQMQEDINEEKRKRRELQSEMDEAKRIVSKMTRQAEDRSQLDIHTMEKKDLENKIQFL